MKNENLNKKVEAAMHSLDGCVPASPKPYLLTRINARLQQQNETKGFWTEALSFISRPVVISACLILVLITNLLVFNSKNTTEENSVNSSLIANNNRYELSVTVAGIYDVENP